MTDRARATALVAEDEPLLAKSLVGILAEVWPEAAVEVVHDGIAAADRALEAAPDVLFLDIEMPGRTGSRSRKSSPMNGRPTAPCRS